ncbi:MAG: glutathionylspermidine synthase family protein [Methylococcales bacterium]|nr:glutathionylspermidine synthase family protein [Methylococcales bacterium]
MQRIVCPERPNWREQAQEFGFHFHTLNNQPYWDETAYYQFTLNQIEQDLEQPAEEIQQMCLQAVDTVVNDAAWLTRFGIPERYWDLIKNSWDRDEPSLYARLDFAYDGLGPAKLYENNADTPTSLYETGFWQWLWLEQQIDAGVLPKTADQFNSLQERLIQRLGQIYQGHEDRYFYFSCCQGSLEDRGTVQYLQDCAAEAGIAEKFIFIEDVGEGEDGSFTDLDNQVIELMFKLYPWEFMFSDDYGRLLPRQGTQWLEPAWKSVLSNKALLPLLWRLYPKHPNLLPAFFEDEPRRLDSGDWIKKPLFSREGSNISHYRQGEVISQTPGPYGQEGFIYQKYHPLPEFAGNHALIGAWLVNDQAAGIGIREDCTPVTQDTSRFLPHCLL